MVQVLGLKQKKLYYINKNNFKSYMITSTSLIHLQLIVTFYFYLQNIFFVCKKLFSDLKKFRSENKKFSAEIFSFITQKIKSSVLDMIKFKSKCLIQTYFRCPFMKQKMLLPFTFKFNLIIILCY